MLSSSTWAWWALSCWSPGTTFANDIRKPLESSMAVPAHAADAIGSGTDRDGPLPRLLYVLTVVTGLVDAVSYLSLGHVFVANMTGNVVFLGFAAAGGRGLSAPRSGTAVVAFLIGAVIGGRVATGLSGAPRHRWAGVAFGAG